MTDEEAAAPDATAVRVALWRALHVQVDAPPHVLDDEVGLHLVAPVDDWRSRPDMDADGTRWFRASIVARARFIDDLVADRARHGVGQYVILGAGLDTFAQRRPEIASHLRVFEVDRAGPQAWKRQRLTELGFGIPTWLRLVPVDFEAGDSWWERITAAGFDPGRPAVVVSTGVSMYLTNEANLATLRQVAGLARGSTFATTFLLPPELLDDADRPGFEAAARGARAAGTPFISFYTPEEILTLARDAGFREAEHVSAEMLNARYFAGRTDGMRDVEGRRDVGRQYLSRHCAILDPLALAAGLTSAVKRRGVPLHECRSFCVNGCDDAQSSCSPCGTRETGYLSFYDASR